MGDATRGRKAGDSGGAEHGSSYLPPSSGEPERTGRSRRLPYCFCRARRTAVEMLRPTWLEPGVCAYCRGTWKQEGEEARQRDAMRPAPRHRPRTHTPSLGYCEHGLDGPHQHCLSSGWKP